MFLDITFTMHLLSVVDGLLLNQERAIKLSLGSYLTENF